MERLLDDLCNRSRNRNVQAIRRIEHWLLFGCAEHDARRALPHPTAQATAVRCDRRRHNRNRAPSAATQRFISPTGKFVRLLAISFIRPAIDKDHTIPPDLTRDRLFL